MVSRITICRLACAAVLALGAIAGPPQARGAAAGSDDPNIPAFAQEPLPGSAVVAWTALDPAAVDLRTAAAGGASCRAPAAGRGCVSSVAALAVPLRGVAAINANYTNGDVPIGLAVVDHVQVSADDPHTTTLCVGDRPPDGPSPVTIGKGFDATRCRSAVSGEGLVSGGQPFIEDSMGGGDQARFWFSVDNRWRVERTLVGVTAGGGVLLAVATSDHAGGRSGMTLPEAAAWLIQHGALQAIALDGGHMSDAWVAGRGDITPLERGVPPVKTALVVVPAIWRFVLPPPPPPPATAAPPTPAPTGPAPRVRFPGTVRHPVEPGVA